MFGYSNEICGETGLGWSRRMMMFARSARKAEAAGKGGGLMDSMARNRLPGEVVQTAPGRVAEIIRALGKRLEDQRASGSRFFIGNQLSALDIYWATFSGMCAPLAAEICPMSPGLRKIYGDIGPAVEAVLSPLLIEHRDFIYRSFLQVPLEF